MSTPAKTNMEHHNDTTGVIYMRRRFFKLQRRFEGLGAAPLKLTHSREVLAKHHFPTCYPKHLPHRRFPAQPHLDSILLQ